MRRPSGIFPVISFHRGHGKGVVALAGNEVFGTVGMVVGVAVEGNCGGGSCGGGGYDGDGGDDDDDDDDDDGGGDDDEDCNGKSAAGARHMVDAKKKVW